MAKQKNDTDKDLLFSKLLPALNNNPFSATYQGADAEESAAPPEPASADDPLSSLRHKLFARSPEALTNTYVTINVMENLVPKYIDQAIRRFNTCSCDRCRCDIAAHALNNLPPKYTVSSPKEIPEAEDPATTKQIMDALVNAVIYVRSHPNH